MPPKIQFRLQLLRTLISLYYQKIIFNGKLICTINLRTSNAGVLICSQYHFYFLASARVWLDKWRSCPAISCSWAATHLTSITAPSPHLSPFFSPTFFSFSFRILSSFSAFFSCSCNCWMCKSLSGQQLFTKNSASCAVLQFPDVAVFSDRHGSK